ncbi:MAG: hypothetical protein H8E34_10925 [Bacteroidetes bacterium]|nr:hypothetical protein [Bacteroidota bacterium]
MITLIICLIAIAIIIAWACYATWRRKKRIADFRDGINIGSLGKIYLYGDSSFDDYWYYIRVRSINLEDDTVGVVYKSAPNYGTVQPKFPKIDRLFPLSKKKIAKLKGTF